MKIKSREASKRLSRANEARGRHTGESEQIKFFEEEEIYSLPVPSFTSLRRKEICSLDEKGGIKVSEKKSINSLEGKGDFQKQRRLTWARS